MLSKKLSRLINKLALVAIIFASIAPSISHAIAAQTGTSFAQEICSSNGKKITIQVLTTKGQQLATQLVAKDIGAKLADKTTPTGLQHHLQHCPFCGAAAANVVIPFSSTAWIFMLAEQAKAINNNYATPFQPLYLQTTHPSRAPPALT